MKTRKRGVAGDGGIHVSGSNVSVGGDMVGRDKVTSQGITPEQFAQLAEQFKKIYESIDKRPTDANVDKSEIRETVSKIETEARKGSQANPSKIDRWLRFLAEVADDVFQITAAALISPFAGVAKAVQLIAAKAKEGKR
jgi:hypothetical protein